MPDLTGNELLSDKITRRQVYLERIALEVRNGMNNRLDATTPQLKSLIEAQTHLEKMNKLTKGYEKELKVLEKKILKARSPGYKSANDYADGQFLKIIEDEAAFINTSFDEILTSGLDIASAGNALVPRNTLLNILALGNFQGKSIQGWYKNWELGDLNRINTTVRVGLSQGQTLQQITRAIVGTKQANYTDGTLNTTRRAAESLARTNINGITNAARSDYYERNADILEGVVYTATLDSRTSELCASLDSRQYKSAKDAPQPPLHPNCRSTLTPVVEGFGVIGERPAISKALNQDAKREYIENQASKGMSKTAARKKWGALSKSTKDKYYYKQYNKYSDYIGNVPAETTYNQWLKRQPALFQNDVLGKTKGEIFRSGRLQKNGKPVTLSTFVDENKNKPYTLAQLRQREPNLFSEQSKSNIKPVPSSKLTNPVTGAVKRENAIIDKPRKSGEAVTITAKEQGSDPLAARKTKDGLWVESNTGKKINGIRIDIEGNKSITRTFKDGNILSYKTDITESKILAPIDTKKALDRQKVIDKRIKKASSDGKNTITMPSPEVNTAKNVKNYGKEFESQIEATKSLDSSTKESIRNYKGYGFKAENDGLRSSHTYSSKTTKDMDKAFSEMPPIKEDVYVYRATIMEKNKIKTNNNYFDAGFSSTSSDIDEASQFLQSAKLFKSEMKNGKNFDIVLQKIKVKRGTKILTMDGATGGFEKELLINRGSSAKIISAQDKTVTKIKTFGQDLNVDPIDIKIVEMELL